MFIPLHHEIWKGGGREPAAFLFAWTPNPMV